MTQHTARTQQQDEYFCSACKKRWAVDEEEPRCGEATMTGKPAPCPKCQAVNERTIIEGPPWFMQCGECGFRTVDCPTEAEALAAWNARTVQADLPNTYPADEMRVLLLAAYCGDDDPECSNARPCNDCLAMCNVAVARGTLDVLGGLDYLAAITRATGAAS